MHNEKLIVKMKSDVKKKTLNPCFNNTFELKLPKDENVFKNLKLDLTVWDWNRMSYDQTISRIVFGEENGETTAVQHWNEIIATPNNEVEIWHELGELIVR